MDVLSHVLPTAVMLALAACVFTLIAPHRAAMLGRADDGRQPWRNRDGAWALLSGRGRFSLGFEGSILALIPLRPTMSRSNSDLLLRGPAEWSGFAWLLVLSTILFPAAAARLDAAHACRVTWDGETPAGRAPRQADRSRPTADLARVTEDRLGATLEFKDGESRRLPAYLEGSRWLAGQLRARLAQDAA